MAILYSRHAATVMAARAISPGWVESTLTAPEASMEDPADPALLRAYRRIGDAGGRILRVVYRRHVDDILVVTAFFDRGAR